MQRGASSASHPDQTLARKSKLKAHIIGLNQQFSRYSYGPYNPRRPAMHSSRCSDHNPHAIYFSWACMPDTHGPCSWVSSQRSSHPEELWTDGVRDYLKHVEELLSDFKDIIPATAIASAVSTGAQGGGKPLASGGGGEN